jgi:hypothetical protein
VDTTEDIDGQHLTVDACTRFAHQHVNGGTIVNSIFTATTVGGVSLSYSWQNASSGGVYKTIGAGSHYLADTSPHRNQGTPAINPTLANDLKSRTTFAPDELTGHITADTTLSARPIRDTDVPDRGYHYDAMDWVVNAKNVSAILTLSGGVAIGTYGSSVSYGLAITSTGSLVSEGTPAILNWIVRYNTVQEQSISAWSSSTVGPSVRKDSSAATVAAEFTGWSLLAGLGEHFNDSLGGTASAFRDCQFSGGRFTIHESPETLFNCLWERVAVAIEDNHELMTFSAYNNLMFGGSLALTVDKLANNWILKDNFFDRTTITSQGNGTITHDYNGYITGQPRLYPNGANDVVVANMAYAPGLRGDFYQAQTDLKDKGSRTATAANLTGFTSVSSYEADEGTVDIGFHYYRGSGPTAQPCTYVITAKGQSVTFQLTGSDPICNEPLDFVISQDPNQGGTVTLVSQDPPNHETVTYTPPDANFEERDFFEFTVSSCGFVSQQPGQVTVYVASPPLLITSCREDRIWLHWSIPDWIAGLQVIAGFRIYRCDTTPPGPCTPGGTPIAEITDPDKRFYEDSDPDLQQGRTYCYRVTFFMEDACDPEADRESPFSNTSCSELCSPPAVLITGNTSAVNHGPIKTYDFRDGNLVHSFVPQGATGTVANGRGLAIRGDEIFYTELDHLDSQGHPFGPTDLIHVATQGPGETIDTRTFQNPRPGTGIQDLAFYNDALYILTGYLDQEPWVYKLNSSDGSVVAGPIAITGPAYGCDGFTVLPRGPTVNFLINDGDAEPIYREYDGSSGNLVTSGLVVDLTPFGFPLGTGVATSPDGQSLYFIAHSLNFGESTLVQTDMQGNVIAFQEVGHTDIEDIDVVIQAGP